MTAPLNDWTNPKRSLLNLGEPDRVYQRGLSGFVRLFPIVCKRILIAYIMERVDACNPTIDGSVAKFECVFALCQCCAIVFSKKPKAGAIHDD